MVKTNLSTSSSNIFEVIKFLKKSLYIFPIFIFLILVNYIIDPASLYYRSGVESLMANIIISGQNIHQPKGYNERVFQKTIIKQLKNIPEIIVLGSSRSMSIGDNIFLNSKIFNHSVSSSTIEDFLFVYENYLKRKAAPPIVILGLDPWLFNRSYENSNMTWINEDYLSMRSRLFETRSFFDNFLIPYYITNLFSPSYFQSALTKEELSKINIEPKEVFPTMEIISKDFIRLKDGRLSYPFKKVNASTDEVSKAALAEAKKGRFANLEMFYEIDIEYMKTLDLFINFLKLKNTKILIYIPPYHPDSFQQLKENIGKKNAFAANQIFIDLVKKYDLLLIGSMNPEENNLSRDQFIDSIHIKDSGIEKLFFSNSTAINKFLNGHYILPK